MDRNAPARPQVPDKSKKLIHLSRQVLEKVRSAGVTTGNQLAKEIIQDFSGRVLDLEFKNIQRRVYDALNVLDALNVISKYRNEIRYRGLIDRRELNSLREQLDTKKALVEQKRKALTENLMHYIALHKLVQKNKSSPAKAYVSIPFVLVKCRENPTIFIEANSVNILGQGEFKIFNDTQVLGSLCLHEVRKEELHEDFPQEIFEVLESSNVKELVETVKQENSEKDYREMYFSMSVLKTED
mmetsp:Transcript_15430/g.22397  ORF Transcript_15430/g.22397 Transcript_15430/m.22397 type:complete len:242 (+) Transcript_15430:33-758(+)